MSVTPSLSRVLMGFSLILLICAVKNYLAFFISGTAWCPYLCPSAFEWAFLGEWPGLKQLFMLQQWLLSASQALAERYFFDRWDMLTRLLGAPVIEEILYRGPLYLSKRYCQRTAWWLAGALLAVLFALSHERSGVALLPILALGVYNLWLVAKTGRLWPAIVLHFLYNFFFSSLLFYQSLWASD